jgi:hypothetical protein
MDRKYKQHLLNVHEDFNMERTKATFLKTHQNVRDVKIPHLPQSETS